jgi:predicted TIM-barrel fold metal-dependent hydrolase
VYQPFWDYPVGEKDPIRFVRESTSSEEQVRQICGGNAARLLNLH